MVYYFGAWAPADKAKRILDVGTGTGLIALQLAQRNPHARITAIEIDAAAAGQATENVSHSPWADRVEIICHDFRDYQPENRFDLIVSNPPYFIDALKCPDEQRCTARHAGNLNYDLLFRRSASLLEEQGVVSIIIPAEAEKRLWIQLGTISCFHCIVCKVFTKPGKPCRRVLLNFGFEAKECREEKLCIEVNHNEFTPEYVALTKDFYLKM